MFSGALVAAMQARTLSVADFGNLSLVFSVNAMAIILSDMGIMNTAIRRLSNETADRSRIVSGLLTSRFLMGLLLAAIGIGASSLLIEGTEGVMTAVLVLAGLPLGSLTATQALSQAKLNFKAVNSLLVLQNFLWLAAVSILALLGAGLFQFGAAFLICAVVQGTTTWVLCGTGLRFKWRSGLKEAWPLVKQALPLGVGSLAVTAYYRLTGVILFAQDGPTAAGNFSAAFRFLDVLQAIPATLSGAFLPLMARNFGLQRHDRAREIWSLAVKLLLAASIMVSLLVGLLADPIVTLLYGAKYSRAADLLGIIMLAFTPVCMGWLLTGVVTAQGRVKAYSCIAGVVAALSVAGSFLIIPVFGASGAAWITVSTEFLMMFLLACLVFRYTGFSFDAILLVRIGLAAATTALVIIALRPLGFVWAAPFGVAAAGAAIVIFRVITISDLRALFHRADVLD